MINVNDEQSTETTQNKTKTAYKVKFSYTFHNLNIVKLGKYNVKTRTNQMQLLLHTYLYNTKSTLLIQKLH